MIDPAPGKIKVVFFLFIPGTTLSLLLSHFSVSFFSQALKSCTATFIHCVWTKKIPNHLRAQRTVF